MNDKPPKKHYENQGEAFQQFEQFILPRLKGLKSVKEAKLWGSLAQGAFGVYEKEYRGQQGSDVDLVILLEEGAKIPPSWRLIVSKSWFDGYRDKFDKNRYRNFPYHGTVHQVDYLVVKRDKLDVARERLNEKSKGLYLKKGVKEELR